MTATVETDISRGLSDHLKTLSNRWNTSWPNLDFDVPTSGNYIVVSHTPNPPVTRHLGSANKWFSGIYQVKVVTKKGIGEYVAKNEANRIARHFAYLTDMNSNSGVIRVQEEPTQVAGIETEDTYEVPVLIMYGLSESD